MALGVLHWQDCVDQLTRMKYCLLSELKSRLGIDNTDADTELNRHIEAASAMVDRHLNRVLGYSEDATFEFSAGDAEFVLERYPVDGALVFQVRDRASGAWSVARPDYDLPMDGRSGVVRITSGPLGSHGQVARVLYAGGYVLPENSAEEWQYAMPEDIQHAVIEQVAGQWNTRHHLRNRAQGGEAAQVPADIVVGLLPTVQAVLEPYRRYRL